MSNKMIGPVPMDFGGHGANDLISDLRSEVASLTAQRDELLRRIVPREGVVREADTCPPMVCTRPDCPDCVPREKCERCGGDRETPEFSAVKAEGYAYAPKFRRWLRWVPCRDCASVPTDVEEQLRSDIQLVESRLEDLLEALEELADRWKASGRTLTGSVVWRACRTDLMDVLLRHKRGEALAQGLSVVFPNPHGPFNSNDLCKRCFCDGSDGCEPESPCHVEDADFIGANRELLNGLFCARCNQGGGMLVDTSAGPMHVPCMKEAK